MALGRLPPAPDSALHRTVTMRPAALAVADEAAPIVGRVRREPFRLAGHAHAGAGSHRAGPPSRNTARPFALATYDPGFTPRPDALRRMDGASGGVPRRRDLCRPVGDLRARAARLARGRDACDLGDDPVHPAGRAPGHAGRPREARRAPA